VHGRGRSAKITGVKSSAQDASDTGALLRQARQRTGKLLADMQRERSQWESAQADSAIAVQGGTAASDVIAAVEQLAATIDIDCSAGHSGIDHIEEGSHHDE